jgi:prepilin-type N-terminal cleavage/methylation domain-containing protein/prepilin-type processing-associated H-X9-DG protein
VLLHQPNQLVSNGLAWYVIAPNRSKQAGFTLVELLVVLAILGVLISLFVGAVIRIHESASRIRCASNLRQIGLAVHQYHDTLGQLPPGSSYQDGKDPYPFMSWLTRLLPYVEEEVLWRRSEGAYALDRDFRNDPPHVGFDTPIPLYTCPSDPRTAEPRYVQGLKVAFTDYLGNEGVNLRRLGGVLFLDSRIRLTDITDGLSSTLMAGERPPSADGRFGWWYAGWGQNQDGSAEVVLGVREKNVRGLGCPPGPYEYGPGKPQNQCDMFHFWSLHAGKGANFLFCDGSVHFIPYAAKDILPALATRDGHEAVAVPD